MRNHLIFTLIICLFLFLPKNGFGQKTMPLAELDALSYKLILEPDLKQKSLKGSMMVHFLKKGTSNEVAFDCGGLEIDEVKCAELLSYRKENQKLIVKLDKMRQSDYLMAIKYHGSPRQGVQFFPEIQQAYSVFNTQDWMPCNRAPHDRASIMISLLTPDSLQGISNGRLVEKLKATPTQTSLTWEHQTPIPAYTYGFAIGKFQTYDLRVDNATFQCFSHQHSPAEMAQIFKESGLMLRFFEEKAGVKLLFQHYNQILGQAEISQEMAGFTVLRNSYGQEVLKDSTSINLGAHELAHQWWGNMLTCTTWNHFWLNEGFAVFMSSAFKESRFGRESYLKDMEIYKQTYQQVKDKGKDKPLIMPWNNPSPEDRSLVYYKGAYVLHLLREELGEDLFWQGIKKYTQTHYGKSVSTKDFQITMEKACQKDLQAFFAQWCYGK